MSDNRATDESNALITKYMPMARRMAIMAMGNRISHEIDDAIGEAMLALTEAARSFRPDEHPGVDFSVYARKHIEGQMADHMAAERHKLVRVPRRVRRNVVKVLAARGELVAAGQEPSIEAIALRTALDRRTVVETMQLPHLHLSPMDLDAEDLELDEAADDVWDALDHCTEREQAVMARRFGLDGQGERSRGDVAAEMGVDVKTVRKAEESARRKLDGRLRLAMT